MSRFGHSIVTDMAYETIINVAMMRMLFFYLYTITYSIESTWKNLKISAVSGEKTREIEFIHHRAVACKDRGTAPGWVEKTAYEMPNTSHEREHDEPRQVGCVDGRVAHRYDGTHDTGGHATDD